MATTDPAGRSLSRLALAFAGRFAAVLGSTVLGLVLGLLYGAYRATVEVAAMTPPGKLTLGMETAGVVPIFVWAGHLFLGAAGGAVIGLAAGVIGMVAWRLFRR